MGEPKEEEEKKDRKAILLKERKKAIYNLVLLGTAVFVVLMAVVTMAWFAINKDGGITGMGVKSQAMPYEIQTRNVSGFYKNQWEKLDSNALEWKVSADYNFDNNDGDLDGEETEPGLEPGDSGKLEFRVNPNYSSSITVDCIFDFKIYVEEIVVDEHGDPVLDENDEQVTAPKEIDNSTLLGYVKSHIMLFSGCDTNTGKYYGLISTDAELKRVLEDQIYTRNGTEYTTIYWKWPMHLEELTSNNDSTIIYAPNERTSVINYIAANRTSFFKDCGDTETQVKDNLTTLSNAYDNSIYNRYNMKYDNADLDIGNNVSYVMLSMTVVQ